MKNLHQQLTTIFNEWITNIDRIHSSYLLPFFVRGVKKDHDEDDMYTVPKSNQSSRLGETLLLTWRGQLTRKKDPSLLWTMCIVFKWEIIKFGIINALLEIVR